MLRTYSLNATSLPAFPFLKFLHGDSVTACALAVRIAAERGQREKLKAFTADWRPFLHGPEAEFAALSAN
jgi:hypothetical protein